MIRENICDTIKCLQFLFKSVLTKNLQCILLLWSNACGVNFIIFRNKKACIPAYVYVHIMMKWPERYGDGVTMTSHGRHLISNHRSFDCLIISLCGSTSKKHESTHCWPFVKGIHLWPVKSPQKSQLKLKCKNFHFKTLSWRDLNSWWNGDQIQLFASPFISLHQIYHLYKIVI